MATNKANNLLFIFIALAMAQILHQANAITFVDQWCARTNHDALCRAIVNSDKRANLKTSPNGIITILRDSAVDTAFRTSGTLYYLLKRTKNEREIKALRSCDDGYKVAISKLKSADFRVIDRATYITLVGDISDANDVPRDCELAFKEPPAIPSPIAKENESLRDICATVLESLNLIVCNSPSFC